MVELSTVVQALKRFYDTVIQAVIRHVRFDGNRDLMHMCVSRQHNERVYSLFIYTVIKCLLVASPGFVKVSCLYNNYVCTCVLFCTDCRMSFVNIYLLRLSRVTIKLCWKISLSFFWYAYMCSILQKSCSFSMRK